MSFVLLSAQPANRKRTSLPHAHSAGCNNKPETVRMDRPLIGGEFEVRHDFLRYAHGLITESARRPTWVNLGHSALFAECLLYPQ